MDFKKEALKIVAENINAPGLVSAALDRLAKPALEKLVQKTDNVLDDTVLTVVYPVVKAEADKFLVSLWAKLIGGDEPAPEPVPA